jgi:hypothetical protein
MACIGQRVAASVPAHLEGHSGARAYALDEPIDGVRRPAALSGKDVPAWPLDAEMAACADVQQPLPWRSAGGSPMSWRNRAAQRVPGA